MSLVLSGSEDPSTPKAVGNHNDAGQGSARKRQQPVEEACGQTLSTRIAEYGPKRCSGSLARTPSADARGNEHGQQAERNRGKGGNPGQGCTNGMGGNHEGCDIAANDHAAQPRLYDKGFVGPENPGKIRFQLFQPFGKFRFPYEKGQKHKQGGNGEKDCDQRQILFRQPCGDKNRPGNQANAHEEKEGELSRKPFKDDGGGWTLPASRTVFPRPVGADGIASHPPGQDLVEQATGIIFAKNEASWHEMPEAGGGEAPTECGKNDLQLDNHQRSKDQRQRYLGKGRDHCFWLEHPDQASDNRYGNKRGKDTKSGQGGNFRRLRFAYHRMQTCLREKEAIGLA